MQKGDKRQKLHRYDVYDGRSEVDGGGWTRSGAGAGGAAGALLDEFERSGLSGVKFAQMAGVKYPTFALRVQKRCKARKLEA